MYDNHIVESLGRLNYDIIRCCKKIKGWQPQGEDFALLTKAERLEDSYRNKIPSIFEDNVYLELFQWYIENRKNEKKSSSEDEKSRWEEDMSGRQKCLKT